jgi:hypothetical protein
MLNTCIASDTYGDYVWAHSTIIQPNHCQTYGSINFVECSVQLRNHTKVHYYNTQLINFLMAIDEAHVE